MRSLERHRAEQRGEREAVADNWSETGYVFTMPLGQPIDPKQSQPRLHRPAPQGPAPTHVRFRDLRHSIATLLLEQGVELVVIKEPLGHAHIGVTATVYAHVRLRLARDAIDLLGRTLGKPSGATTDPDATTHRFVQQPSADVAVNYCPQDAKEAPPKLLPVGPP